MSVTQRFRQAVADRDAGAVAVVVAISSVLLFGVAALVIDIGQAYAKRRAAQTDADLAALAGAAALPDPVAAFNLAYTYLQKNLPSSDAGGLTLAASTSPVWTDGDPTNGEITISNSNTRIRVIVPNRRVDFGFANALPGGGFKNTNVRASATVDIKSPATSLPFYLTNGDSGETCLHDNTGGGGSAMRAVLLAPTAAKPSISAISPPSAPPNTVVQVTLTGKAFVAGSTSVTFTNGGATTNVAASSVDIVTGSPNDTATFDTPATLAAGTYSVTVTTPNGTSNAITFTVTAASPSPTPTPTPSATPTALPAQINAVAPNHGPVAGGTAVTLTGVHFTGVTQVKFDGTLGTSMTVVNDTTITVTTPSGVAGPAFSVVLVTPNGQTLNAPNDYFTYDPAVADPTCPGDSSNRGFGDIPRLDNDNKRLIFNIATGLQATLAVHPMASSLGAGAPECSTLAGSLYPPTSSTYVPVLNCIPFQTGSVSTFEKAWFSDTHDPDGRMRSTTSADTLGSIGPGPYTGVDVDHISKYLNVSLATFTAALASGTPPTPGWIKPEIALCPRFALLPVINLPATIPSGNHAYPIRGFKGFFVDDDPASTTSDHGFTFNGGALKVVKGYAFDLKYADGVISNGTGGTVTYVGAGPKIPVLVHDAADPAY